MALQLVNRKCEAVLNKYFDGRRAPRMTLKKGAVYFSRSFCLATGIKAGSYMHFLNDGMTWKFYVNSDPDGFVLTDDKKKNGALYIYSVALASMICKSTASSFPVSFPVAETAELQNRKPVYLIRTLNPITRNK